MMRECGSMMSRSVFHSSPQPELCSSAPWPSACAKPSGGGLLDSDGGGGGQTQPPSASKGFTGRTAGQSSRYDGQAGSPSAAELAESRAKGLGPSSAAELAESRSNGFGPRPSTGCGMATARPAAVVANGLGGGTDGCGQASRLLKGLGGSCREAVEAKGLGGAGLGAPLAPGPPENELL